MTEPGDAVQDGAGNLYVADYGNCRVLQYKPPFTNGMAANLVIGQPNFTTPTCNITQNGLGGPSGSSSSSACPWSPAGSIPRGCPLRSSPGPGRCPSESSAQIRRASRLPP